MAWEKSIFIGCTHGDLVCNDNIKVFRKFMDDWKPKHRVHLGDAFDFRAIRKGAWEAWHVVKQHDGSWLSPHGTL